MKMFRTRLLTYAFLGSAYLLCQNVTTYAMPVHTAQTVIFQPQSSDNRMGIATSPAAGEPSAISSDTTTPEQSNTQPLAAVRIRKCTATSHSAIHITWTKKCSCFQIRDLPGNIRKRQLQVYRLHPETAIHGQDRQSVHHLLLQSESCFRRSPDLFRQQLQ